jgi:zinc protease
MKKTTCFIAMLFIAMTSLTAMGQEIIPTDTAFRIGKLANGLTYYIRHNEASKNKADFYIIQNVGSVMEEDNQRGLAHFLEHMCFNGTENFPGDAIEKWCQSVGIKENNAYTHFDRTVYNISDVPVERESVQDSCLLILHDWACALTLDDDEIDAERGVIHEEWRSRLDGASRLDDKLFPQILNNSKYAYRLPIGLMEIVDNFPHQALRDYYKTWYRPDLQAIIVVGDVNVDRLENKIKEMFSTIVMPENAKPRPVFDVPDNQGINIVIGSDKELSDVIGSIYFKHDVYPKDKKNTLEYIKFDYLTDMVSAMLGQRLKDIQLDPTSPLKEYYIYYGDFRELQAKEAMSCYVIPKGKDILPVIEILYREVLRAKKFGFTENEYNYQKELFKVRLNKWYANRAYIENEAYVDRCVDNFAEGEPLVGNEDQYALRNKFFEEVTLEEVNSMVSQLFADDNRVLLLKVPEKDGYTIPTEQEASDCLAVVEKENLEQIQDNSEDKQLIRNLAPAGKIVSESHDDLFDATVWTLSNGAKVVIKPTTLREDEVLFRASASGGTNVLDDTYISTLQFFSDATSKYSLGDYSIADLLRFIRRHYIGYSFYFQGNSRSITGSTTKDGIVPSLEVLHALFTDFSVSEAEFASAKDEAKKKIMDNESNQKYVFGKRRNESFYENPRLHYTSVQDVENATLEQTLDVYRKMMADASDFTFMFIGNVDVESLREPVEKYLASLPADNSFPVERKTLPGTAITPGEGTATYTMPMETPQTWTYICASMDLPCTWRNEMIADMAGSIFGERLRVKVREEMGAVYSIYAYGTIGYKYDRNAQIYTGFPMNPEYKDQVLSYIESELKNMENTVKDEELKPWKETWKSSHMRDIEENSYYSNKMYDKYILNLDYYSNFDETLDSITIDDIRQFFHDLAAAGNYRVVVLDPEQK